jgi:sarcosine oxidase
MEKMHNSKDTQNDVDAGHYYGFPYLSNDFPSGFLGFKCAKYDHFKEQIDPDHFDRRKITEADNRTTSSMVNLFFPKASGDIIKAGTCMFTNTPDSHFLIDYLEHADFSSKDKSITYISACSGHGFKFASAIGYLLADFAEKKPRPDVAWLGEKRFHHVESKL